MSSTWVGARLDDIVNGRRNISTDSALTLGEAFKTGPELWLNLQRDWDLWHAMDSHRKVAQRQASTPVCRVLSGNAFLASDDVPSPESNPYPLKVSLTP